MRAHAAGSPKLVRRIRSRTSRNIAASPSFQASAIWVRAASAMRSSRAAARRNASTPMPSGGRCRAAPPGCTSAETRATHTRVRRTAAAIGCFRRRPLEGRAHGQVVDTIFSMVTVILVSIIFSVFSIIVGPITVTL